MLKSSIRWAALATAAIALTGCASTGQQQRYQPPPPDPATQARLQQASAMADLNPGNVTYAGRLPPNVAPVTEKTDDLGRTVFIDTAKAVSQYGEPAIRQQVVMNVKLCGRVTVQRIALAELRRQTDAAEANQAQNVRGRKVTDILAYGGMTLGAVAASSAFGSEYGMTYILGNFIPGVANQATYGKVLKQNDIMIALSFAQNRYWYSQNDFWLDSMEQWCPSFMNWVEAYGQIVPTAPAANGASSVTTAPLAPARSNPAPAPGQQR